MTVEIENDSGKSKMADGVLVANNKPIAQKKAESAGRKAAPNLHVSDREVDWRARKLQELNDRDDGFEYSYVNRNITDWDLEYRGAEIVKNKEGRKMHFKGDPIIRREKALLDKERKADGEFSEQQVKNIVKTGRTRVMRNRKSPSG